MTEQKEPKGESPIDKMGDKIRAHDSSSSDSDDDKAPSSSLKTKIYRLFGREKPVHKVLGGGKPADVLLWRDKKVSGAIVGGVTVVWLLFEVFEYYLLTLICHLLIASLSGLFLWSNAAHFINKSPPRIPEVKIQERPILEVASGLTYELNRALASLRNIASGRDLKKFLSIVVGLWIFSILGSCCNFLTLFYISFVLLHTLPVLYEKYDDKVDYFAERGMAEFKKYYVVFEEKVLSKIPRGSKGKKAA